VVRGGGGCVRSGGGVRWRWCHGGGWWWGEGGFNQTHLVEKGDFGSRVGDDPCCGVREVEAVERPEGVHCCPCGPSLQEERAVRVPTDDETFEGSVISGKAQACHPNVFPHEWPTGQVVSV
jgi:hypothetical protein